MNKNPGTIVLCHKTAFRFWRTFTGSRRALRRTLASTAPLNPPQLTDALRAELCTLGINPAAVVHVLVGEASLRRQPAGLCTHLLSGPVPAGSFLRLSDHVLITSPELTFAQVANALSREKAIMAGCELCGTYALIPCENTNRVVAREALTSANALTQYLENEALVPGRENARRRWCTARQALPYLLNQAASPMETKLALMLSLPPRLGGMGLPAPRLNQSIVLGADARTLYRHATCRADLFWPSAQLDVEYDGLAFHEGDEAHTADTARAAALRLQGIDVMSLTYPQVANDEAFLAVAELIAQKLSFHPRTRVSNVAERRAHLRYELWEPCAA